MNILRVSDLYVSIFPLHLVPLDQDLHSPGVDQQSSVDFPAAVSTILVSPSSSESSHQPNGLVLLYFQFQFNGGEKFVYFEYLPKPDLLAKLFIVGKLREKMPFLTFSQRVAQLYCCSQTSNIFRSHSLLILFRPKDDDIHETSNQEPNSRTPSDNGLSTLPVDIQREISTNAPEGLTGVPTTDHLRIDSTVPRDKQGVVMALKQDTSGSKTLG